MKSHTPNIRDRRGRRLVRLLLILGCLVVLVTIAWAVFLPSIVVSTIRSRTGCSIKIEHFSANAFTGKVDLSGIVLENPESWPSKDFLQARRIYVDAELFTLFSSKPVIDEAVLDVACITVVTNEQGAKNFMALRQKLAEGNTPAPANAPTPAKANNSGFLIKHLVLKCDRVVYADYSGGKPKLNTYDVNLSRDLRDVDSVAKIVNPLTGSLLGSLANALSGNGNGGPEALTNAIGTLQDAGRKTGETLKDFFHSLEKKKP